VSVKDADRVALFAKAAAELLDCGQSAESTNRQLMTLSISASN
jgi:hypothetical protein